MTKFVRFYRRPLKGTRYRIGTAYQNENGWRFIPSDAVHRCSRKSHPTMEKCIPRWVGYPDGCESEEAGGRDAV